MNVVDLWYTLHTIQLKELLEKNKPIFCRLMGNIVFIKERLNNRVI